MGLSRFSLQFPGEGLNLFAGHDEGDRGADKDYAAGEYGRKGLVGVIRSGTATAKRQRKQFSSPFVFGGRVGLWG